MEQQFTRIQMVNGLFADYINKMAFHEGLSIDEAIRLELDNYSDDEKKETTFDQEKRNYSEGKKVLSTCEVFIPKTIFYWNVPEEDNWAKKSGMPEDCVSYIALDIGYIEMGRKCRRFAFFIPRKN